MSDGKQNQIQMKPLIVYFEGNCYDLGPYTSVHPGGSEILLKNSGKDITQVLLNQPAHQPVLKFIRNKLTNLRTDQKPES